MRNVRRDGSANVGAPSGSGAIDVFRRFRLASHTRTNSTPGTQPKWVGTARPARAASTPTPAPTTAPTLNSPHIPDIMERLYRRSTATPSVLTVTVVDPSHMPCANNATHSHGKLGA